jgi:hypothetical protein
MMQSPLGTLGDPSEPQNIRIWAAAAALDRTGSGVQIGGSRVTTADQPQSLSVIGTLADLVPDRRLGASGGRA